MSAINGGPAFPNPRNFDGSHLHSYGEEGMSLRDWFASQERLSEYDSPDCSGISVTLAIALAGYPCPKDLIGQVKWEADWRAALRYIRADSMVKARKAYD